MSETSEWLVPFRGRNASSIFTQNFMWEQRYSLFHMDQHYDTLASRMPTWLENLPSNWSLGIDAYLSHKVKYPDIPPCPLFSWDNYLSIFLAVFGGSLETALFATHGK